MVLCTHLPCSLTIRLNVFAFLFIKANSKVICEEISLPFFFLKKADASIFLLRFKANYLENMRGSFYFWIPIALANVCFFHVVQT